MADAAYSLALLEVANLSPALMVADVCAKAAGVHIVGIESTDGPQQCIKLAGTTADVTHAAHAGRCPNARSVGGCIDIVTNLKIVQPVAA